MCCVFGIYLQDTHGPPDPTLASGQYILPGSFTYFCLVCTVQIKVLSLLFGVAVDVNSSVVLSSRGRGLGAGTVSVTTVTDKLTRFFPGRRAPQIFVPAPSGPAGAPTGSDLVAGNLTTARHRWPRLGPPTAPARGTEPGPGGRWRPRRASAAYQNADSESDLAVGRRALRAQRQVRVSQGVGGITRWAAVIEVEPA